MYASHAHARNAHGCPRLAASHNPKRYAWSYGLERVEGTATPLSSACLQLAHATILYAIWRAEPPPTYTDDDEGGGEKRE